MKTRSLSLAAVCLAASLCVLLAGCFHPGGEVKRGVLTVSIKNSINARTLLPPINMDAAGYTIQGTGPNGATFSQSTSGGPVTVEGLAFGTWTVTVNALNAHGDIIGQGEAAATLSPGQDTTLAITVVPLGGTGDLNLTVTWAASLLNPSVHASLMPFSGDAMNLDFGISGNLAGYSGSAIPAGYYTLALQLMENGFPVMGAVEAVRIVSEQMTSGSYDFTNVNRGTFVVNITPELANPLPVSISGVPSTVATGTGVTASAGVSDATPNVTYAWYLNGVYLDSGQSITFGSTLGTGYYRLDVMAFTADGKRAGSATASFQVVKSSIPSIVGSWNFFRAWAKYTGVTRFAADGQFTGWDDYAETMQEYGGTWALSGDTLTMIFSEGGPGGSLSVTPTWVNANQVQFSIPGQGTATIYRKGFEPDGYLFNNPKYPPITLVRDTPAQGNLPSDGLALYQYVAGPNAQDARIFMSTNVQIWFYVDEQTTIEPGHPRWSGGSQNAVALVPGHTYYIVVSNRSGLSGDYSIMMTETAYVGTWVNPAYDSGGPPARVVLAVNSQTLYQHTTDTTSIGTYSFTAIDDGTSGGAHYYRIFLPAGPPGTVYALCRLSNNNNMIEANTSFTDYPTSIDPADSSSYSIFWRQ